MFLKLSWALVNLLLGTVKVPVWAISMMSWQSRELLMLWHLVSYGCGIFYCWLVTTFLMLMSSWRQSKDRMMFDLVKWPSPCFLPFLRAIYDSSLSLLAEVKTLLASKQRKPGLWLLRNKVRYTTLVRFLSSLSPILRYCFSIDRDGMGTLMWYSPVDLLIAKDDDFWVDSCYLPADVYADLRKPEAL